MLHKSIDFKNGTVGFVPPPDFMCRVGAILKINKPFKFNEIRYGEVLQVTMKLVAMNFELFSTLKYSGVLK